MGRKVSARENILGSFADRKRRWVIYVTDRRIVAVDRTMLFSRSLIVFFIIAASYLLAFAITLPFQLSIASYAPLIVLAAFFPTLYFAPGLITSRFRTAEKTQGQTPKLEISRPEIDQVEIVEPGLLTAHGKLVVRSSSGGVLEFTLVGAKQFHYVVGLMRVFTRDSQIVFTAKPKK